MDTSRTLSAKEAAALLGVNPATIYAYVSRGLIRSEPGDSRRERRYSREDVQRLAERQAQRRDPTRAAEHALRWGAPVLESARNRFPGVVTQVQKDGLVAVVHIQAGPHRVTSMMTREAADELAIEPGDLAVAVVKSTNVVVEVPRPE